MASHIQRALVIPVIHAQRVSPLSALVTLKLYFIGFVNYSNNHRMASKIIAIITFKSK